MSREHWAVIVERDGEQIVTLASDHMSGRDLSIEDERVIEKAAEHLMAFLGRSMIGRIQTRAALHGSEAGPQEAREALAWVIEYDSPPRYWSGREFSLDHMQACRFVRREDADRTLDSLTDRFNDRAGYFKVVEHMWGMSAGSEAGVSARVLEAEIGELQHYIEYAHGPGVEALPYDVAVADDKAYLLKADVLAAVRAALGVSPAAK